MTRFYHFQLIGTNNIIKLAREFLTYEEPKIKFLERGFAYYRVQNYRRKNEVITRRCIKSLLVQDSSSIDQKLPINWIGVIKIQ